MLGCLSGLLGLAPMLSGCAALVVRPEDPPSLRNGKTAAQLVLSAATLTVFPKLQREYEDEARLRSLEQEVEDDAARFRRFWLHRILDARTLEEMSSLFGHPPRRCLPSRSTHHVCTWTSEALLIRALYEPRVPEGRIELPVRSDTVDQVVVVACELPFDGTPRGPDSCDVAFW